MPSAAIAPAQLVALAQCVKTHALANTENEKYFTLGTGAAEHAQPLDIPYAQLRIMPTVKTGYTFTKGISFVIMAPGTSNLREGVTVWIKNAEGKSADAVVSALVKGIMALSNNPQAFCHEVEA